jgi:thymidylate kinase
MSDLSKQRRTNFVSLSGIDGAGKSTQIDTLCARMREHGLRVKVITFWDNIARLTGLREGTGHRIFKGEKGVGSPDKPVNRMDKNVQSFPMTCVRLFLYSVDAVSVRLAYNKALRSKEDDLVVFDRYIYDEFANLNLSHPVIRLFVRMLMRIVPRPDISYVLDADPVKARARKPEYPLEFLHINRQAYLTLAKLIGGITIIDPMGIEQVKQAVVGHALMDLPFFKSEGCEIPKRIISGDKMTTSSKLDRSHTRPAA